MIWLLGLVNRLLVLVALAAAVAACGVKVGVEIDEEQVHDELHRGLGLPADPKP